MPPRIGVPKALTTALTAPGTAHEQINQLGHYTVMGVLSLCGFPLELFDLNFGLSAFILRRGPRREGIDP